MIIEFEYPDVFVPEEIEFVWYSAIKLYKGKIVDKKDAMEMMGLKDEIKFNEIYNRIEKRFKKLCGDGLVDSHFEENK